MTDFAVCDYCGKPRRLTDAGVLERHRTPTIVVSKAAIPSVGRGSSRPWCSGSGKAPRRREA
jgi:hypothetical protein